MKQQPSAEQLSPQEQATREYLASQHYTLFTDFDIYLFRSGKHFRLHEKFGAHYAEHQGQAGVYFALWAPFAKYVTVVGDFNGWDKHTHAMQPRWDESGVWELFIPNVEKGTRYKYYIESHNGYTVMKGDPYAFRWETPPNTASRVWDTDYKWSDKKWMQQRAKKSPLDRAISVYEVHPGSWIKPAGEEEDFYTYRDLAEKLPAYCVDMGFTHVEFMPVMEHPYYPSWGYQITGYFATTSRYGSPQDFMYLVEALHKAGIGVLLDWVPSHFPTDEHGLGYFDGTHLYEHEDPRQGFHPDWKSYIFNFGRAEVRSFLISNALFWLERFHIDGFRVDAVASMLFLSYSRNEGEWIPNKDGGPENLEAIHFLREFNDAIHDHFPDVITIAEDSSAWPGVTHNTKDNDWNLGFDLKWMMGWMNDTLKYFEIDPIGRSHHHSILSFSIYYFFNERYMLPLSHDEVVHLKHSLLNKMPGDRWQQFANLRLLFAYMYGHPGAKLVFMGGEFAQNHEWQFKYSLDWAEAEAPENKGIQQLLRSLNKLYCTEPALNGNDLDPERFEWIAFDDATNSVISWMRKTGKKKDTLIFVYNFTPIVQYVYGIGVPHKGEYKEVFNSDSAEFGGSGVGNSFALRAKEEPLHDKPYAIHATLPPLAMIVLKLA